MSGCTHGWGPRRVVLFVGLLLALAIAPAAWGAEPFSLELADLQAGDLPTPWLLAWMEKARASSRM